MKSTNEASRAAEPNSASSPSTEPSQSVSQPQEYTFTAFKTLASEKISSLLQGILGLPSSFSDSKPNTSHWAVFEEDTPKGKESTLEALHRSKSHELTTESENKETKPTSTSND